MAEKIILNSPEIIEKWSTANIRFKSMYGFVKNLLAVDSPPIPLLDLVRGSVVGTKSLNELVQDEVVSYLAFKLKHPDLDSPDDNSLEVKTQESKWCIQSGREFHDGLKDIEGSPVKEKIKKVISILLTLGLNVIKKDFFNEDDVDTPDDIEKIYKQKPDNGKSFEEQINELRA